MFERLAQKVLSKFLSKYFTEESLAKNKIYTSTQLGVWSGYVSLQDLELKQEVINSKLRRKGQPFEIVHCSFRQVEITIPWAKLSNPMGLSHNGKSQEDAVVVVVLDGIHILARATFDFDDIELRKEDLKKRRQGLADAFTSKYEEASKEISYAEILKKRLKDGLLQDISEKIHIHLRDLHIRMEDVESDPQNPYAFGATLESMHIQHDDEKESEAVDGIVSKMAQLNHLAVYWNALEYGNGLPVENSVLHQTCRYDPEKLARSLNFCIARRASFIASPSRDPYIPTHTYLLLPVDGTWHGHLSTNPTDLSTNPAVDMAISIQPVSAQLRDFQCVQFLRVIGEYQNHKYVKKYRRFRPLVSVKQDPKAWWLYAARAIRYQMRESFLRWSWSRFRDVYIARGRYMNLYERRLLFPTPRHARGRFSRQASEMDDEDIISRSRHQNAGIGIPPAPMNEEKQGASATTTPDEGAGPSTPVVEEQERRPLTDNEFSELRALEDGLQGDLSISTILLFRAVVNMRLGRTINSSQNGAGKTSWWAPTVESAVDEDSEARAELDKLLAYLDKSSAENSSVYTGNADQVAISIIVRFDEFRLGMLTPLTATLGENQVRQIHEKFLDFCIVDLRLGFTLKGDYESKEYQLSMLDLVGTEIRSDKSQHVVAKQVDKTKAGLDETLGSVDQDEKDPLLVVTFGQGAPKSSGRDVTLVVFVNTIELALTPQCEWIGHVKAIGKQARKLPNVGDYWDGLSLASFNSLALGRLGLIAKAESVVYEHKNLDAEITIQCPILRIEDGKGNRLIIDLGIAHFKTEKLAGVSGTKANALLAVDNEDNTVGDASVDRLVARVDDASAVASLSGRAWASRSLFETPVSARRRAERHFTFSSALSIDSRNQGGIGNRSMTGSLNIDEPLIQISAMNEGKSSQSDGVSSLFYDIFSFQLQTGKITFCGDSELFAISNGFEVSTILKKSVLPADHTLCKLKAHTNVNSVSFEMNEKVIIAAVDAFKTWKALVRLDSKRKLPKISSRAGVFQRIHPPIKRPDVSTKTSSAEGIDEVSLSQIDENEFFDAKENADSFAGENSAVWFDDNWISDAESFIDGDSRSHDRRTRQRRASSISDVSSTSDQSTKDGTRETTKGRKPQQGNAYLSAENLVRLEEGGSEDESLAESAIEIDDASFHSVMSSTGQKQVLQDLEDDASRVETRIRDLDSRLEDSKRTLISRSERKSIKMELHRATAELNGLRALYDDLKRLLTDTPLEKSDGVQQGLDGAIANASHRSEQARNAKALLAAKRKSDSLLDTNNLHSLTRHLNRELFQGSFMIQHFQLTLHVSGKDATSDDATNVPPTSFDFVADQIGVAFFRQLQDSKLYFSSDQVSATLRNKFDHSIPSRLILSGGSTDTLLPSHFPHLVSRSMEEKFLRGAIHMGKRRATDTENRRAQAVKLRLVVGDVEVLPSQQVLGPLLQCLTIIRSEPDTNATDCNSTENSNLPALSSSERTDHGIESIKSQELSQVTHRSSVSYDFAIRLSSFRMVLSHSNRIVGAAVATETAMRYVKVASRYRNKLQVDLRCTNLQLLEISSLETGRGSEIAGRRDPYNALVLMRARSQLVRPNECGGWVVGIDKPNSESLPTASSPSAVTNMHISVKVNPLSLLASPEAISGIMESSKDIKGVISSNQRTDSSPKSDGGSKLRSLISRFFKHHPLRWRLDFSIKRVTVKFPNERGDDWMFTDNVDSKMTMAFSVVSCMQESVERRGNIALQMALTELAIIRSSDDWPILEPCSFLGDICLAENNVLANVNCVDVLDLHPSQLKLNPGSTVNEISAILHRYGWDSISLDHSEGVQYGLIAKLTPIKTNITVSVVGLVVEVAEALKTNLTRKKAKQQERAGCHDNNVSAAVVTRRKRFGLRLVLEEIEIQVLHEAESKPIAHAKAMLSFTMADVRIDYEQGEQVAASILIRNSSLFDLSSTRGVRVIGENTGEHHEDSPYVVRVKLYMDKHLDGPNTVRLEINWGRIQCLVMPSFLKSVLSLKSDFQSLLQVSKPKSQTGQNKDILDKFLGLDNDVNLSLSAHADAFELILSSKDIAEYIRQGGTEPIGVVTFRWKASLSVTLALDTLQGSSVPWLTLDLDGKFTDPDDTALFKDFVNRYLSQSSGLLAGSNEIGQKVLNAFTARVGLFVTDFQVMRTNICSSVLKPPSRTVSYESAHRMCFTVIPPPAGEQRVTNPIDLDIVYRTVGASMEDVHGTQGDHPQIEISQLIQVKAKFVDVLLYISQSAGGWTEAYKTTVKPILEILKKKETRRKADVDQALGLQVDVEIVGSRRKSIPDLMKGASSMCTIQFEGFQITCVPGGATRLNESPIIKLELNSFSSGIAATSLPAQTKLAASRGIRSRSSSQNLLVSVDLAYMTVGGWITCEISGHYHNRRLVAWEPFVEPWTANIRFGVDAVDAFRVTPTTIASTAEFRSPSESKSSTFDAFNSSSFGEGKGDRLRDFGRLFRAPFQTSLSSKQTPRDRMLISHSDFCYLMLASTSRSTILSVLYPTSESPQDQDARLFSRLPAREKVDWLRSFGFPGRENDEQYSISCSLSDSRPLNINLTGALLENVLGYLQSVKTKGFRTVAPHWIRNDTGMTIRFQEVLDVDRVKRGEEAGKSTVVNGSEMPLTLKRSLSQTCDPHRAYMHLELGSFEDTVGRIKHDEFDIPKGSLSSSFFFKAAAKIPVDTVGVHRYPLDRNMDTRNESGGSNSDSRALGWIIVRVALRDGIKVVSVESPFVLKSTADTDLICEIRDHNGLSLLWRCLIPKSDYQEEDSRSHDDSLVSVPADIVPFLHNGSYTFSAVALMRSSDLRHEVELTSFGEDKAISVSTPPPFSPQSYGKGLIGEEEVTLATIDPEGKIQNADKIHLTVCSFRIGSFSGVRASVEVPEQRMVVFRSPVAIRNCLALPISVQVRVKNQGTMEKHGQNQGLNRLYTSLSEWEDLGFLDCGQAVNWTGARSSDKVQIRVRFVGTGGDNSRRFPGWSSPVFIPAYDRNSQGERLSNFGMEPFAHMRVSDAESVSLHLSVGFDNGENSKHTEPHENIRFFSQLLSAGTRAVSIFVPCWIVDSTNQDFEFFSGTAIAGQLDNATQSDPKRNRQNMKGSTLGLAELLDNDTFLHLPSSRSFNVMMVGDESSTRLTVRKRAAREARNSVSRLASPWSDPIPLQSEGNAQYDITVLAPKAGKDESPSVTDDIPGFDRFVLRSSISAAPERFGGLFGTKLIHIVNRYSIVNETGRDIEIASDYANGSLALVRATGTPQPFHFDNSRPIRFRFKEFGWTWSGKFNIRMSRSEVTMRLCHKMKGKTVIVTVELMEKSKGSTTLLVFRESSHPPFRLENHTMFPLHFGQSSTRVSLEDTEVDAMLLPYQSADFAWDEPELRRRTLVVRTTDRSDLPEGSTLGRFQLDKIAPGTILHLEGALFAGEVVADGPTRVMRITDASMPSLSSSRHDELTDFQHRPNDSSLLTLSIFVKLSHGIGISVVDWSPQELLYARLDDIQIERKIDTKIDSVSLSIGKIKLNNQLWVTPYPVLLRMGRRVDSVQPIRRRNRRHDAINLSWRRSMDTHGGYGNLTLLEKVEISSEPVFVNVDGKLADLLFQMVKQISWTRRGGDHEPWLPSRDDELRRLLNLGRDDPEESIATGRADTFYQQNSDGDLMTTAAIAAKLRAHPLPFVRVLSTTPRPSARTAAGRKGTSNEGSQAKHKIYIEKLKISATKADLSWSGPLPGLVSSLLLRALTFERMPLRLRPYSSSHAYGNMKDHLQSLKSHYVSFWRILDLLLGLSSNPTFLFRAVVYTSRETCASILDSWATDANKTAKDMKRWVAKGSEVQPRYDDGIADEDITSVVLVRRAILSPFARSGAFLFTISSAAASLASSILKYSSQGSKRLAARGLVRSRNPRLFAHMDGKDLLVEYVEGENAGKALLSRVRMGMHLGEGYIYHLEGACRPKPKSRGRDLDPSPLIVMVTSERTLLLNGKLDWNFCAVVWEAMFTNIVHLELVPGNDLSITNSYDEVVIWYLSDTLFSEGNLQDKGTAYAQALAAGVDVLHSISVFVPKYAGAQLVLKMGINDKRLVENHILTLAQDGSKFTQD